MNLPKKEKVKCRTCGKEGEIESDVLMIEQAFRIHFDENGYEYFLCSDCEPAEKPEDRDSEEGEVRW
jgi:hypothetical protein